MVDVARLWDPEKRPDRKPAISRLRHVKIQTIEDLWWRLASRVRSNSDFEREITAVAKDAGIDREELLEILASDAAKQAADRGRLGLGAKIAIFARCHGPEIALALALAAAAVGVVLRVAQHRTVSLVAPRQDLAAYHLLATADLYKSTQENLSGMPSDLLTSIEEAVGRYTLRHISAASPLRQSDLSRRALPALKGRRVASFVAELGGLEPLPGTRVSLVFAAPGEDGKAALAVEVEDVLLLALERQGGQGAIVVALTEADLELIKPVLGSARVLVVHPAS